MSDSAPGSTTSAEESQPLPAWLRALRSGENGLMITVLSTIVLLPLIEVVLRKTANFGIAGSNVFVQHFTLLVGVLGGAIAAREGRLLSLSSLPNLFHAKWKLLAAVFASAVGTAISAVLCVAAWKYVHSEPAHNLIAYGIPLRAFQLFLPVGYGVVALRLIWTVSPKWLWRAATLLLAGVILLAAAKLPIDPAKLV